jgi:glycosyltransferase involved in cell wall biosynthesis
LGQLLLTGRPLPGSRPIHLVAATCLSEKDFWQKSALGKSLKSSTQRPDVVVHIHYANRQGLSTIYNTYIRKAAGTDILLFVHDDVIFNDADWPSVVRAALGRFDIIGVAGNIRLLENQSAWLFRPMNPKNPQYVWDQGYLSGTVLHKINHQLINQVYGPTPMQCSVLDGVLIAADCTYLKRARVSFDEQFDFDFYDMDFCRAAGLAGLRMGTWPIAITHLSEGAFGTPQWQRCWNLYQEKWRTQGAGTKLKR